MKRAGTWVVGTILFFLLAAAALRHCFPDLPQPLRLEIRLDAALPRPAEPIVVTGVDGMADYLYVRSLGSDTVVFGYDSWGAGGPTSSPLTWAPGTPHRLEITMPSLGRIGDDPGAQSGPLRVSCDGIVVLDRQVSCHWRAREQVFLGTNPAGGTSCGPEFHGTLRGPGGRLLRGGPRGIFSRGERIGGFWTDGLWRVWPLLLVAAGLAVGGDRLGRFCRTASPSHWPWSSLAFGSLCLLGFGYCITDGSFRFIFPESFSSFYDYQALSLLHGRLDVPQVAVGDEAFIFQGKYYGYFGVTPALLRIPFVVLDLGFGELSRSFLCADFVACLVFAYLILREAFRLHRSFANRAAPTAWGGAFFVVAAGIGSPLFFLSSRAYIYHEAILCGAAFALAGCYFTLRYLAEPERRWWLGATVCGLLSVHARPSTGLFALSFTGFVAAAHLLGKRKTDGSIGGRRPFTHLLVGAGCILGVLSFNGLGYLKFHTFDGAPLRYHVQYYPGRLNRIGGRNFHLVNLPYNFESYLVTPTFEFKPRFPFFFYAGRDPVGYRAVKTGIAPLDRALGLDGGLRMDMTERMVGLPYAVPGLCLLALFGVWSARFGQPGFRRPLALLWMAVVPFALAMFAAVATAERYTADFCPFLLTAAAFGLAAVEAARWRGAARAAVAILTLWSVFVMVALTLHHEGVEAWGLPDEAKKNYENLSQRVDRFLHLPDHDSP